jgi:4-coumarate--CoA ligase
MSSKIYKSSYGVIPLPEQNAWHFLFDRNPNLVSSKPAFIDGVSGRCITFGELPGLTKKLAYGLIHKAGLMHGETLLIFSPNHLLFPVLVQACAAAALVCTTANAGYSVAELFVILWCPSLYIR